MQRPLARLLAVIGVALTVVVVSAVGVASYAAYDLEHTFSAHTIHLSGEKALPPNIGAIEGGVNLMLVGSDECDPSFAKLFGARCTASDAAGARNDVDILVHISNNPRRVTVISFPRDLMIPIPACTNQDTGKPISAQSKQMLNSTLDPGGVDCVVKTVEQLSGQHIDMAAKLTWGGVINITDAVGGVTVCIQHGIKDKDTGLNLPAGMVTVQGMDALEFLRTRHGVGDGSDLGRISNQQQYFSRLAHKIVSEQVLSDPVTLYKLATTAVANITPSANLANPLTLVQIALAVKSVPFDQIVFVQYPTMYDPSDPNRVIPNRTAADALWSALAANKQLLLSGKASQGNGVVVLPPTASPVPAPSGSAAATPGPSPSGAADAAVTLPASIAGQTAAQQTCSNGNG